MIDPRFEALSQSSRHQNKSVFKNSEDSFNLLKRTMKAKAKNFEMFEPYNIRYLQNVSQDESAMEMTIGETNKSSTTIFGLSKEQALTIEMIFKELGESVFWD